MVNHILFLHFKNQWASTFKWTSKADIYDQLTDKSYDNHGEKKRLDGDNTKMLQAILNKSWKQHLKKQELHTLFPSILKTILVRQTGHAGHSWRNKHELVSDVF